ncbi:hypothetical protein [Halomonas binhaiensis]|uniref:Uncharacterized protein n=1 Tax=Halomonas binhaiensis TaxID=2562282 RepID=A0A5C1NKE5_9GAMM|nr:hypothetical protein [Halomonas binhaiensis]QEM82545.1 hypothetical protein E4T21_14065 [Halomonas binhaiensis]
MSDRETTRTTGNGSAILTTNGAQSPANVDITHCDKIVPRASDSIYGKCNYYYEPMMFGDIERIKQSWPEGSEPPSFPSEDGVEKTGVTLGEYIEQSFKNLRHVPISVYTLAESFELAKRAWLKREELLDPESDIGWSRYGNFWARHVGCGHIPPDYYTHYGYYYCSRYAVYLLPRLSPRGKQWMADARYNLQVYLDDVIQANMNGDVDNIVIEQGDFETPIEIDPYELELESRKFREAAFATHVNAYLDAGLSELSALDLYKIGTMPNVEEWLDTNTYDQVGKSGLSMAKDWWNGETDPIENTLTDVKQRTSDMVDKALERLTSWF